MVYLDEPGATAYLFTTEFAIDWGVVGLGEYFTRLACLLDMMEPNVELHRLLSKRLSATGECQRGWPDDRDSPSSVPTVGLEADTEGDAGTYKGEILHFVTAQAGVLGEKWKFNKYDNDFFPSVPHGHLKTQPPVKLDAYRGYTYDTARGNTTLAREKRDFIVALWRDEQFRNLARAALAYFVERHAFFDWRRQRAILHPPLRLPRKFR